MELNFASCKFLVGALVLIAVSAQYEVEKVTPKPRMRPSTINLVDNSPKSIPQKAACVEEGFAPYPEDCTKFIRCVDQSPPAGMTKLVRFEFDCAPGTVFDPSLSICNFPDEGGTPRGCQLKIPVPVESESRSPKNIDLGPYGGPDQKGGGHYKYILVTDKAETIAETTIPETNEVSTQEAETIPEITSTATAIIVTNIAIMAEMANAATEKTIVNAEKAHIVLATRKGKRDTIGEVDSASEYSEIPIIDENESNSRTTADNIDASDAANMVGLHSVEVTAGKIVTVIPYYDSSEIDDTF